MLIILYILGHGWTCFAIRESRTAFYPEPELPPRSVIRAGYWPTRKSKGRLRYPVGFA